MTDFLAAIPGIFFVALCYWALCLVSPFGTCRKCRGFGFQLETNRRGKVRRGRDCRRCDGYGKRLRIGRWVHNRAVRFHHQGTR